MKQDNGNHAATPGPWAVCNDGVNVYAPETDMAITNQNHFCAPDDDEAQANARLIAAAPELLEALESMTALVVDIFDNQGLTAYSKDKARISTARAAIAKAKGD